MKKEENVFGEKGDGDFQGWGTGLYRVKNPDYWSRRPTRR